MRGWKRRIFAIDLYCAADSGYIASLISTTRPTIDQPQLPSSSCRCCNTQNNQPASTAITVMRLKSTARSRPGTCCASICLTSLGPTHSRAWVLADAPGATVTPGPTSRTSACPACGTAVEKVAVSCAAGIQAVKKWCCSIAIQPPVTCLVGSDSSPNLANLSFSSLSLSLYQAAPWKL